MFFCDWQLIVSKIIYVVRRRESVCVWEVVFRRPWRCTTVSSSFDMHLQDLASFQQVISICFNWSASFIRHSLARLCATTVSYNAAIASCVRRGAWRRALLVLQQMPAPDATLTKHSFCLFVWSTLSWQTTKTLNPCIEMHLKQYRSSRASRAFGWFAALGNGAFASHTFCIHALCELTCLAL